MNLFFKSKKLILIVGVVAMAISLWWSFKEYPNLNSISLSSNGAELSIQPYEEPFSVPPIGSSLFDKVFSKKNEQGVRVYSIPYPFTKIVARLTETSGGVNPQIALFPMGRSLQRSAAIEGTKELTSLDPFYRFPRIVLGFDTESKNDFSKIPFNFKEKLYIGMNERAKVLEVISYNDEAGRFEYQVVRDYTAGKNPSAVYVNRQLCLTCHQNQTPIFSRAPWSESNANSAMQEGLQRVLSQAFGEHSCEENPHQAFCYSADSNGQKTYKYWGAPIRIDQQVSYSLDLTTKMANFFHGYHKMYQKLCADLSCRKNLLKQILIYKLNSEKGLLQTEWVKGFNQSLLQLWQKEFSGGLALPDAAIPNRDPLLNQKDRGRENLEIIQGKQNNVRNDLAQVLANSDVPGEFEPLLTRGISEVWSSPLLNDNTLSRLVFGYASFFTQEDVRQIDNILVQQPVETDLIDEAKSLCILAKTGSAISPEYIIRCQLNENKKGLQFSAYLKTQHGRLYGSSKNLKAFFKSQNCRPDVLATSENVLSGAACAPLENVFLEIRSDSNGADKLYFQTQTGISLRTLDARRFAAVNLPKLQVGEEKNIELSFQLVNDLRPLNMAIENAFQSGDFRKYADGPALNRYAVLSMILKFLGKTNSELFQLTKEMMTLKKVSEAPDDELGEMPLKPLERAQAHANKNCAVCHFNREGVPPAFLGGPQLSLNSQQKCLKFLTCAPRILYRLKMWDCPESEHQIKKTPMPPTAFVRARNLDLSKWVKTDRIQFMQSLIQVFPDKELKQELISSGYSEIQAQAFVADLKQVGCPVEKSTGFEKLPRCDQEVMLQAMECLK